ncbi:AI-2E family transporter [uncultured Alsobacter sp.]|uniref:AI-2E family transporter n=1 Tax=uncultured Alsobacter sp. TaxID=1748258 RepID=UPI0025FC7092|nr:AI-2E family transporter [uncultured Alsobacter sp.]
MSSPPAATRPAASTAASTPARVERGVESVSTASAIFIVAGLGVLWAGQEIFVPIAVAILLSFVLAPLVRRLQAWRLPRGAAVPTVVVLAFLIITGLGAVVTMQLTVLANNLPQYQTTIREKAIAARGMIAGRGTLERAADMLQDLGRELQNRPAPATAGEATAGATRPAQPMPVEVHSPAPGPLRSLIDIVSPVVHPLATVGLIVIFVVFILLQREDLRNRLIRLAGSHDIQRTTAAIDDAAHRLSRLYLAQLGLNAGFGCFIAIGLWLIGLPNPILWGILAAILRFVPYIGGFISAAFPLTLAIAVDPGWSMLAWTAALFLIGEPLVGHVLEPLFFGRSTGLSPVAVVVSAAFWTWLWGPIGLVLATPLTVCLVVLGRHVERLAFLDVMFGSTPALSPPEVFYQRMLARDPIEAADQAEDYLADNALAAYYDDIALPGLRMAQDDRTRGALEEERIATLRDTVADLVEDLTETLPVLREQNGPVDGGANPSAAPSSWADAERVLCIPARSPLDEASALMLGHALSRSGLASRVEGAGALSSARIVHLPAGDVDIVVLCSLDTSSIGHLRYAVRRIQRRLPGVAVVLAAWDADAMAAEKLAAMLGPDRVVTSISEALTGVVALAVRREDDVSDPVEDPRDPAPAVGGPIPA